LSGLNSDWNGKLATIQRWYDCRTKVVECRNTEPVSLSLLDTADREVIVK
jgi:hypothetical protein